jgi:hypothetical protein
LGDLSYIGKWKAQKEVRMRYRRLKVEGASSFCTVNLADRLSTVLVDHVDERRNVMRKQTWGAGVGLTMAGVLSIMMIVGLRRLSPTTG